MVWSCALEFKWLVDDLQFQDNEGFKVKHQNVAQNVIRRQMRELRISIFK